MTTENNNLDVDVFWSMRSPYCYIALDRCLEMPRKYNVNLHLRVCYPIIIKEPGWIAAAQGMKYRLPYQNYDARRTADFHNVAFTYPDPDPAKQRPTEDSPYGEILPFEEQTDIQMLSRTAVGAAEMGKGWEYLNEVSRMVWNGLKRPWNANNYIHLRNAIQAAGIDADALIKAVTDNPDKYDKLIDSNQELQKQNDCGHFGVPCFVFRGEPFFGQDRIDMLIWRLKQYGLEERADYQRSLRAQLGDSGND